MIGIFIRVQKNTGQNSTKFGRLTALGLPLFLCLLVSFPNLSFAQCTLFCKTSLNVSLPFSGEVQIPASLLLANTACDPNDFHVEITDESNMNIGDIVSCTQSGQSVTA